MAGGLDIVIDFLADTSKLRAETAKVQGTGSKLKSWAKGVGAAIGAAFAVDQIKDWIGAASELQDAMSASQQIFGTAAGEVAKFAKGADKGLGISQKAAIDAANNFATFGKSAGLTGPPLAKFATKLTGLAGDLASFKGTSPEQAIEAIGAALRGETEPIRAYGVLLDDATLRQQALSMGLIKTTKEALTPQQKVLAAQAQLFKQTGDAQGDFQRTSDSAANQQKILAAEMENTKAALGDTLLPVLKLVLPPLQALAGFIQQNAAWLVPLTAAVLGVAAAVWVWNAAMAANPVVLITLAVAALIAGIILLAKNWDKVWSAILGWIKTVWGWIKTNWPLLLPILLGPIGIAAALIIRNIGTITGAFQAVWNWLKTTWSTVETAVTAPFKAAAAWFAGLPKTLGDIFVQVAAAIAAPFRYAFNAIAAVWNNTVGRLSFHIPSWVPKLGGKGFDVPNIPTFQTGGVMPHTGLALLHKGETVTPAGRTGPVVVVEHAHFSDQLDVEAFMRKAAWVIQTQRI